MLQSDSRKVRKLESTDVKASKTPPAPRAYTTPELVVLGQACRLVQGNDLTKDIMETDGTYFQPY